VTCPNSTRSSQQLESELTSRRGDGTRPPCARRSGRLEERRTADRLPPSEVAGDVRLSIRGGADARRPSTFRQTGILAETTSRLLPGTHVDLIPADQRRDAVSCAPRSSGPRSIHSVRRCSELPFKIRSKPHRFRSGNKSWTCCLLLRRDGAATAIVSCSNPARTLRLVASTARRRKIHALGATRSKRW
jgi:hypothetical protein